MEGHPQMLGRLLLEDLLEEGLNAFLHVGLQVLLHNLFQLLAIYRRPHLREAEFLRAVAGNLHNLPGAKKYSFAC